MAFKHWSEQPGTARSTVLSEHLRNRHVRHRALRAVRRRLPPQPGRRQPAAPAVVKPCVKVVAGASGETRQVLGPRTTLVEPEPRVAAVAAQARLGGSRRGRGRRRSATDGWSPGVFVPGA